MDLREKTRVILTGVIIIVIILIMVISFTVFINDYRKIENEQIVDYSNLVEQNVKNEIENLDVLVADWGPWDDTYNFVEGKETDFVQINIDKKTFQSLNLDFFVITNAAGDIVYSGEYDEQKDEVVPLRSDIAAEISRPGSSLRNMDINNRTHGFLSLPGGMVVLSTYPVVHSDYSGIPRGMVIMGRFVDESEITRLSLATRLTVSIIPFKPALLPNYDTSQLASANASTVLVRVLDEETIEGDRIIPDASGDEKILIRIEVPRDIYAQGKSSILNFILIILAIQLAEGILIIVLLDSQVLRRLTAINTEIENITRRKNGASRIQSTGNDEITRLTRTMNQLLDQIDKNQLQLQNSEKRFREFAEQFPEIMLELDNRGILIFVNLATYNKFGYTQGELDRDVPITRLFSPEDHARIQKDISRVLAGETLSGSEYIMVKKDGSRFPLILFSAPSVREGKTVGVWIFAGDITKRKQMETALVEMNKKMNLLNSITRHDVDNQLTALFGYTELLEESVHDPQIQNYIEHQKLAAETIRQEIAFTKDYQDIGIKAPQWQNVERVILNANGNHDLSMIAITIDIHNVEIFADLLLERVFFNLVDNVNKYGKNVKALRIYGKEIPEGFVIIVEDDGVGIPYGKKEAIFTRQFFHNTGFGLFLSREILAITGITIQETGEPGKGARFEILVPKGSYRFSDTFNTDGTSE